MTLLFTVLESLALVVLQQPVLAAKVTRTEAAVADDALRRISAVLVTTPDFLGWHATTKR